jgi:hypothetical protein
MIRNIADLSAAELATLDFSAVCVPSTEFLMHTKAALTNTLVFATLSVAELEALSNMLSSEVQDMIAAPERDTPAFVAEIRRYIAAISRIHDALDEREALVG